MSTVQPRVSVIIPTYNTASIIGETLDSVFRQTFTDYEVLVINDDSPDTDALEQVIATYGDRVRYFAIPHSGVSAARNHGIQRARGELIAFLDSDDLWVPTYLETLVGILNALPDVDLVYSDGRVIGKGSGVGRRLMELSPSEGPVTFLSVVKEECCVTISLVARKAALERAGLFDETLKRCEDFDLWLRCLKSGSRIVYTNDTLLLLRRREDSLSSDSGAMFSAAVVVLGKMLARTDLTPDEREGVLRKRRQFESSRYFFQGKKAFFEGDLKLAVECFAKSSELSESFRLRAILLFMRSMPGLLRAMYAWKHRNSILGAQAQFRKPEPPTLPTTVV